MAFVWKDHAPFSVLLLTSLFTIAVLLLMNNSDIVTNFEVMFDKNSERWTGNCLSLLVCYYP